MDAHHTFTMAGLEKKEEKLCSRIVAAMPTPASTGVCVYGERASQA
jgi:hypothetical protein